jgi:hypothetical protein
MRKLTWSRFPRRQKSFVARRRQIEVESGDRQFLEVLDSASFAVVVPPDRANVVDQLNNPIAGHSRPSHRLLLSSKFCLIAAAMMPRILAAPGDEVKSAPR